MPKVTQITKGRQRIWTYVYLALHFCVQLLSCNTFHMKEEKLKEGHFIHQNPIVWRRSVCFPFLILKCHQHKINQDPSASVQKSAPDSKTEHRGEETYFLIKRSMNYKKGPMCTMNWARNLCLSVIISGKSIFSVEATTPGECIGREQYLGALRA